MLKNRLKILMIEKNMKQEELSKIRNVSRNTVSNWVTGKSNPTLEEAFDIAAYFGVTVLDIWKKED